MSASALGDTERFDHMAVRLLQPKLLRRPSLLVPTPLSHFRFLSLPFSCKRAADFLFADGVARFAGVRSPIVWVVSPTARGP